MLLVHWTDLHILVTCKWEGMGGKYLKNSMLTWGTFFFQLEEVMEKETYKTAKLILERFDPESSGKVRILVLIPI